MKRIITSLLVLAFCSTMATAQNFNPFKYNKDRNGKFYVAAQYAGARVGYMNKFGVHLTTAIDFIDEERAFLLGVSKSIIRTKNFQWNISAIGGLNDTYFSSTKTIQDRELRYNAITGNYEYRTVTKYRSTSSYDYTFSYGVGMDFTIGHIYLNADAYQDGEGYNHFIAGIGYVF